ncbi:GatB/YqeY domain-containing protein [uncultured Cocleimonas sp.]|uniref:GatB/YqeY domain-containing protein n=1 Tax=uncultured Cocleimonas sp. TaxID=1051587 RepID=UPI0026317DF7|nr:GatB/YqeY domain-containing protein [uncultured Cocleimonas sp.]
MSDLKQRLSDDMKTAMRAKEKDLLLTVRTILAAIKQQEVDTREDLNDTDVLAILDKLSKQRRESISQFKDAGRDDLVAQEEMELGFIQRYLPEPLSDDEVQSLVTDAIASSGAESMKDMGKVMAILKPQMQGRADMGKISGIIKSALAG